jgi:hypothetical protein
MRVRRTAIRYHVHDFDTTYILGRFDHQLKITSAVTREEGVLHWFS